MVLWGRKQFIEYDHMKSKECFKCKTVKPLSEFYKHKMMADGHLNKCKECNKVDVRENRGKNIEYYREYDRKRGCRQGYEHTKNYRKLYPNKYRAHSMITNAIRTKKIKIMPCETCGRADTVHAHHDDYHFPLSVRWLCAAHHSQWHKKHGEAKNP